MSKDTVELLKECSSGIAMGVDSIHELENRIQDPQMKQQLQACCQKHERLRQETNQMLMEYGEKESQPNPIAKGMSWMKTNAKMAVDMSDETAADLLTDGCNMGVKSLSRYLNQYGAAEEKAKNLTQELIDLEAKTAQDLRSYL